MTFDHVYLIVSVASAFLLFTVISTLSFLKNKFRKNLEAFGKIQKFANELDKSKIPTILLVISGSSFLVWLVTRVVISYL